MVISRIVMASAACVASRQKLGFSKCHGIWCTMGSECAELANRLDQQARRWGLGGSVLGPFAQPLDLHQLNVVKFDSHHCFHTQPTKTEKKEATER